MLTGILLLLFLQIRVLSDEGSKEAAEAGSETDDVFLKKIEATMLTQARASFSLFCGHCNVPMRGNSSSQDLECL